MKYFSIAIVLAIASLVGVSAVTIINIGYHDKDSNLILAQNFLKTTRTEAQSPPQNTEPLASADTQNDCQQKALLTSGGQKYKSVADYLSKQGADYSYAHRIQLAESLGISNYRGTAEQNVLLLEKLQSESMNCHSIN
jgi:hypothetical protein